MCTGAEDPPSVLPGQIVDIRKSLALTYPQNSSCKQYDNTEMLTSRTYRKESRAAKATRCSSASVNVMRSLFHSLAS